MIEAARAPFGQAIEASAARHFAWLYAGDTARELLELFLALEYELQATVRPNLDHAVAHARLAWWQTEAQRAAAGKPVHPLTVAIARRCDAAQLPHIDLRALVATLAWDLAGLPCTSETELSTYTGAWARGWFAPLAMLLAPQLHSRADLPIRLGSGIRALQLLALARTDPQQAGLRLPADALARVGLNAESVTLQPRRAVFYDLLAERQAVSRVALAEVCTAWPMDLQPASAGLLVWAYCEFQESRAARASWRTLGEPGALARIARTIGAWRAALRARAGHFALPRD